MDEPQPQSLETINRRVLAPAVIFGAVTAWLFQTFIMGSDLFWHLAAGRDIWERGEVPSTDPFSHTFGGEHWTNHEWLWDCIYWKLWEIDTDAVAWFTIGVYIVLFAMMFMLAYEATKSMFASGLTVWLGAIACHWFFDIRPHPVTLFMAAIVLLTRNKKWAVYLWPPLIVLWTNLHAGFIFGIGMVGLLTLVRTAEESLEKKEFTILWPQWISVAICVFIWMINPYGPWIAEFQLDYFLHDSPYRSLVEWNPPMFGLNPFFFEGTFWWLVLLAVIGASCNHSKTYVLIISGVVVFLTLMMLLKASQHPDFGALLNDDEAKGFAYLMIALMATSFVLGLLRWRIAEDGNKVDLYLIALSMVSLFLACRSRRFIPLFCVTSAPLVACCLTYYRARLYEMVPAIRNQWVGISVTALGLVVAVMTWSQVRFGESLLRDWAMGDRYPEEEIAWVNEVKPDERVLNYYNWGGYIILHAPGYKLFFDGRANTLYDEKIYYDYHRKLLGGRFNKEALRPYESDFALLPAGAGSKFAEGLTLLSPGWKLVHRGRAFILLPPDSPLNEEDLPTVEDVVPDGVNALINEAMVDYGKGDVDTAIEKLEAAGKRYYYVPRVHQRLAEIYFRQKDADKLMEVFDKAAAMNPRRASTFLSFKAAYLEKLGMFEEAREAHKGTYFRGPFGGNNGRLRTVQNLERVEKAIRRQGR